MSEHHGYLQRALLCRVTERLLILILRVAGHAIRGFLANDTQNGPRHRGEPLRADVLFTVEANPKAATIDTLQGNSDFAQAYGLAIEHSHRKIAFLCVLNSI